MRIFCSIVGFEIEQEACAVSGNHFLCRKCREARQPAESPGDLTAGLLPRGVVRGVRRRCGCGRPFIPGSNRQKFCPTCQDGSYRKKAREWDRNNRVKRSVIREFEPKFRN